MVFRPGRPGDTLLVKLGFIVQLRKVDKCGWSDCAAAWGNAFPDHDITENAIKSWTIARIPQSLEGLHKYERKADRQSILNRWLQDRGIQSLVEEKVRQGGSMHGIAIDGSSQVSQS